jgi:hypothetical protein
MKAGSVSPRKNPLGTLQDIVSRRHDAERRNLKPGEPLRNPFQPMTDFSTLPDMQDLKIQRSAADVIGLDNPCRPAKQERIVLDEGPRTKARCRPERRPCDRSHHDAQLSCRSYTEPEAVRARHQRPADHPSGRSRAQCQTPLLSHRRTYRRAYRCGSEQCCGMSRRNRLGRASPRIDDLSRPVR